MKNILGTLVLVAGITLVPLTSRSQEYPGCFMVNAYGQRVSLGHICGEDSTPTPASSDGTQANAQAKATASGVFSLPIKRRESGIPVVEVTFNGNQNFEMLFDTGASGTTINPKMAENLNIQIERSIPLATAGGTVEAGVGKVASLQAGDLVVKDVAIVVSPAVPVGLLGQNFFGGHDVTIKEDSIELRSRQ